MTKHLLTSILVIILLFWVAKVYSQFTSTDSVSFDIPTDKIIIEDIPENLWQIGSPDKVFFNGTFSGAGAIVTDTINSYPVNNVSSFIYIIRNTLTQDCYTSMRFLHKYDTDTINDYGSIEASYDGGESWFTVSDTGVQGGMFWWDWDENLTTNTLYEHNNRISGNSGGWVQSTFNWQWYIGVIRDTIITNPDSLMVRFTFKSDSEPEDREGWMIDEIFTSSGYWAGCGSTNDIDYEDNIDVFPVPFTYSTTIHFKETASNASVSLYDYSGRKVFSQSNISGSEARIYRDNLNPGLYFIHITQNGKLTGVKKVLITD